MIKLSILQLQRILKHCTTPTIKRVTSGFTMTALVLGLVVAPYPAPKSALALDTGFLPPTVWLDGDNDVGTPGNAFVSDNNYAVINSNSDEVDYTTFGFSIPSGSIITGIEVAVEANRPSGSRTVNLSLSWNNGVTFTSVKNIGAFTSTDSVITVGSSSDAWGREWSVGDFTNANFRLRVEGVGSGSSVLNIDQIQVRIHYNPAISWPSSSSWISPAQCSTDPSGDKSPGEADLVGTLADPAIGFQEDSNYFYFRERVMGNPKSHGNWKNTAWVVLIQTTPPSYQYLLVLNGKDELVEIWQNTPPGSPVDFSPLFNDPADTLLWSGSAANYAQSSGSGPYFVDWAIPKSKLTGTGITLNTTKFFATSQNSNNYNKDHLDCYDQSADVAVTKTASPNPVVLGSNLTYTITATNNGPESAGSVVVTDVLPGNVSFVSDTASIGSYNSGTGEWTIGTLANGATATLTLVVTADSGTSVTNTATISTSNPDPNTSNNSVTTVTTTTPPPNIPPVANNDAYSINEDTSLVVTAPGVLGNDTDADSDPLTAVMVAGPTNGSITLNLDGSFTYTPNANFNGSDSFTYKANDGVANSNVATVSITVTAVNDAPVANDDAYSTNEDTPLVVSASGVLTNDTDIDSGSLTAIKVTDPTNGSVTLNANGSFTYNPAPNFNGIDTFTYKANDGTADSNVATVTITVNSFNDTPVANPDAYFTDEDTALVVSAPGVMANDTDADGDSLTATLVDPPTNGSVSLNSNGGFTYTPNANFNGSDSFTYKVNDGTADSGEAVVTITINPANDPPVASDMAIATNEDTPVSDNAVATDIDGDSLVYSVESAPTHGTLTSFDTSTGAFTYTPDADYSGPDAFTFKVNDGSVDSNVATVSITVTAVNDAPVANDDAYSTNEDTPLVVSGPGVLGNDTDSEGDQLTAAMVVNPANGAVTLSSDGSFTYTPNSGFSGTDSFTYKANDSSLDSNVATVTINVLAAADTTPPVSTFDDSRSHQIIATEIVQLSLTGKSADLPSPGGSGVASAKMSIYRIVDATTARGEGFYDEQSEGGFFSTTCSPLPNNAVQIELVALSLASTADPMVVTWEHSFTPPDLGVYCAIVHATDNNGNIEHTAVAGPFAFNPPATPPGPTGGGGGGGGGTANADLSLTKTVVGGDPSAVGTTFTYIITVSNSGPSNATNVVVTDVLPASLTYVSSTASQGTYDNGTGKWTVGNLAVGSSATLQLTTTVNTSGVINNFASSISSENDPNPANNIATYIFAIGGVAGATTGPVPQVLGAQTELPRTGGMPLSGMLYLSWLGPVLERFRRRQLVK